MPPSSRRERRLRARAPIRKFDGIRRRRNTSAGTRQPHTYYQYASGCRALADAPRHPPVMPPNFRIATLDDLELAQGVAAVGGHLEEEGQPWDLEGAGEGRRGGDGW